MKTKIRALLSAVLAVASLISLTPAHADTDTWSLGGSGTWQTGANWTNAGSNNVAPTSVQDALFGNTPAAETITMLTGTAFAQGLIISNTNSASFIGSGGVLALGADGITMNTGAGAITLGNLGTPLNVVLAASQTWTMTAASTINASIITGGAGVGTLGAPEVLTISGGNLSENVAGALISNGAGGVLSMLITNNGSFNDTKNGNANTFTGGATIQNGSVLVYTLTQLGTGPITLGQVGSSGTATLSLQRTGAGNAITAAGGNVIINASSSGFTPVFSGTLTLNTNVTLTDSVGSGAAGLTFSSLITGGSGLIVSSNGHTNVVTISNANNYTGGTTVNSSAADLVVGNTAALGAAGAALNISAGTVDLATATSVNAYNTTITGNATIEPDVSATGAGITHTLGSLALAAGGSLTVSKGVNVNSGTPLLAFGATTLSSTSTATSTLSPGTAGLTLTTVTGSAITGTDTLALTGSGSNNAITGVISDGSGGGTLAISDGSTGKWTLSGSNTYSGGTTILSGATLQVQNANTLGATTGVLSVTGTLDLFGNSITVGALSGGAAGMITTSTSGGITLTAGGSTSGTYAGVIQDGSGTVGVAYNGTATLTLSGTNTYSGGTMLSSGTVAYGNLNALSSGTATFAGNATLLAGTAGTFANALVINSGATGTLNTGVATTLSGLISGSGALTKNGGGTLTLSNANTYTGITTLAGGFLNLGSTETPGTSGPLGNQAANAVGTIVFSGGTLQYSASNNTDYSGRFATASAQSVKIDTNAQNVTFATGLTSSGGSLTVSDSVGTGSLTLTALDTYSGSTVVSGGTLITAGTNTGGGAIQANGGTLKLDNANNGGITTGTLTFGGGSVQSLLANQSLSNPMSLAGTAAFTGSNSLTLNGVLTQAASNKTVTNNISGAGILTFAGASFNIDSVVGTAQTVILGGTGNTLISSAIQDYSGGVGTGTGHGTLNIQNTAGTITLAGANTYEGATNITGAGGTTSLTGTLANTGTLNTITVNSATATFTESSTGAISGSTAFTLTNGTGFLAGVNNYSGTTTVGSGATLHVAKIASFYNGVTANWSHANLQINGTLALNVGGSGEFSGTNVATLYNQSIQATGNSGLRGGSTLGFDTTNAAGGTFSYIYSLNDGTAAGNAGGLGINKLGVNTLVLSATSNYAGATTVSAGALVVSGSLTGTKAVSVAAGALLSVDGLINNSGTTTSAGTVQGQGSVGTLNITGIGNLAPGLSTTGSNNGTLTTAGPVSLASTATLSIRLGQTSALGTDLLAMSGSNGINLNGATLNLTLGGSFVAPVTGTNYYVIIDGSTEAAGTAITGQFSQGTSITVGGNTFTIDYNTDAVGTVGGGNDVVLALTAVPEPGTWLMFLSGMGVLAFFQRGRGRRG